MSCIFCPIIRISTVAKLWLNFDENKSFSSSHLDEDNEVDNIFNGSLQRRFIRSETFDFPPPPKNLTSPGSKNGPVAEDDSIFGEDSEHVDDPPVPAEKAQIQRTNSITFNIRQGL